MTNETAQLTAKFLRLESMNEVICEVRARLDHRLEAMSIYLEHPTPERLVEVRELLAECQHHLAKITTKTKAL